MQKIDTHDEVAAVLTNNGAAGQGCLHPSRREILKGERVTESKRWDTELRGALSEISIRESLEHPERYRISTMRYPKGTEFSGHTRADVVYVARGQRKYTHQMGEAVLTELEYCEIPEGKFRFEVQGNEDYEEVKVWPLPEAFWGP